MFHIHKSSQSHFHQRETKNSGRTGSNNRELRVMEPNTHVKTGERGPAGGGGAGLRIAALLTAGWLLATAGAADFAVGVAAGAAGGRVMLPVSVSAPGTAAAVQFDVIYGTEREVSEPAVRGVALTTHTVKSQLQSDGRRRVLIFSNPTAALPAGIIVEIPFAIPAALPAGTDAVNLTNIRVAEADGTASTTGAAAPGSITATAPPLPRVSAVRFTGPGGVVIDVSGSEGAAFRVEASTDLLQWGQIGTVSVQNGAGRFTDPQAGSFPVRYYRFRTL